MSMNMEEFLRQAARRMAQNQSPPPPRTMASSPPSALAFLVPAEAEVIDAEPVEKRHVVEQSVAQHLSTRKFTDSAAQLGDVGEQTDASMETHLHEKFDHKLGRLNQAATQEPASAKPARAGFNLAKMFRQPQDIRNAVLLSEILARPENRW